MSVTREKKKELIDLVIGLVGTGSDADAIIDAINSLPEQEIPGD